MSTVEVEDGELNQAATDCRLVRRVKIKNYRNIAACDVELQQLALLVGPNGAGKSNFLDAMCFIAESISPSLDEALRRRNGFRGVVRRTSGRPGHFGIRLDYTVAEGSGYFAVAIAQATDGAYQVKREECLIENGEDSRFYAVEGGRIRKATFSYPPPASDKMLYLVRAASVLEFTPVYEALSQMKFYRLNPERMRRTRSSGSDSLLRSDGSNVASVLGTLAKRSPEAKERLDWYLQAVVPGVVSVDKQSLGSEERLMFRQVVREGKRYRRFDGSSMSDGTLRTVGVLVALLQNAAGDGAHRRLVGIEEPEMALHPAALEMFMDILREGADDSQVVVTTHSSDMLDHPDTPISSLLPMTATDGLAQIGRVDDVGRSAVERGDFTAGDLLRMRQLRPDPAVASSSPTRIALFGRQVADEA